MRALVLPLLIASSPALAAAEPGCKVTLKQFSEIRVGGGVPSLYQRAGCRGTVVSETALPGSRTRMEQWDGTEPGSLMHVYIENGWVRNKTQIGLR
ncbi:hypothetical protein [uncultured Methylobacterium sp.]|jgi:hypothetical protein|uniref:hypothetical protein n=1 Tax=uncultured Methylobacterium sp. TaxID=157278 RepID=UPI00261DA7D6|nr:hypothetical protein [uncultured Methylobacterium sp.]